MRFRKRVKVFPGFYLNFSGSGMSSTIGVKGASINFSKRGTYFNASIPGTGFSDRIKIGGGSNQNNLNPHDENLSIPISQRAGEIKSATLDQLTSTNLKELNETLLEVYTDRIELAKEIKQVKISIQNAKAVNIIAHILLVGFFIKTFKETISKREDYLADLEKQLENTITDIDMHFDVRFGEKYRILVAKYKGLLTSQTIWDITSSVQQDRKLTRSAASHAITRVPVIFKFDNINIIRSTYQALHFENKNGGDLYIYPAFVIMTTDQKDFALIDLKDFKITFSRQRFLEEGKIPSDSEVVDKTWAKVNKNGTPDKRFRDNYEIPVVQYGQMDLTSVTGLNETYSVSNYEKAWEFVEALVEFQNLLSS